MDEPLSNLDAKLRVQTRSQIAALQRRLGVTTVYVTHDQVEAMTMGDRVAVLKDGILQQVDTPRNMYDNPENVFVAGFIGSPAMNLLQVDAEGDTLHFGGAEVPIPRETAEAADKAGRKVTVGVRPEDMDLVAEGTGPQDGRQPGRGARRRRLRLRHRGRRRQALRRHRPGRRPQAAGEGRVGQLRAQAGPRAPVLHRDGRAPQRPERLARRAARQGTMSPMALQLLGRTRATRRCSTCRGTPLEDWPADQLVALPRGISRHVVRFVRLGEAVYAVKEIAENAALREYGLLRQLERRTCPRSRPSPSCPVGSTTRASRSTRPWSPGTCSSRCPTARCSPRRCGRTRPTGCSTRWRRCWCGCTPRASTGATARSPTPCSAATRAPSRRTSSTPRPASCTATCPRASATYDVDLARTNIAGELLDLEAGGLLHPSIDPVEIADLVVERYQDLWHELLGAETFDTGERYRIDQRIRRLNELGFDVAELTIVTDIDGRTVQLEPKVVDAGHHSRRLLRLTGLDVEENQARRLLNDLDAYRAAKDVQGESEEIVAHRWVDEVVRAGGPRGPARTCAASWSRPRSSTRCSSTAGSCPSARAATSA